MSLHPSTARAIRRAWRMTKRSLLATATIARVEPSTVRKVVGPLPRKAVRLTDAVRREIVGLRRAGDSLGAIVAATGVGIERVRNVLAEAGLSGRVQKPACVLCGRSSWALVAYEDADAEAGDRVCEAGAGCQSGADS